MNQPGDFSGTENFIVVLNMLATSFLSDATRVFDFQGPVFFNVCIAIMLLRKVSNALDNAFSAPLHAGILNAKNTFQKKKSTDLRKYNR